VIERCRMEANEHLAGACNGIVYVLERQDFGPAILVDAHRFHAAILTGQFSGATFRS
jgi:hypothetical protein